MGKTLVKCPTSRVLFGLAQEVVNQPVGIFHPMWGAARHFRATGIHRSLMLDVVTLCPLHSSDDPVSEAVIRVSIDIVGLTQEHYIRLQKAVSDATGVSLDRVVIACSHTHATALFAPDRFDKPGGELISSYMDWFEDRLRDTAKRSLARLQEVTITYASGRCQLAINRDFWDDAMNGFTCGFNPGGEADDTVVVARVCDTTGNPVATLVNYACHPTTLAWDNTLISPDFVGSMREEISRMTGAPCVFFQGASGDLGPKRQYVGDVNVADQNGRQLAYAALSALESMGPPQHDYGYEGPVISGATLGVWAHQPFSAERLTQTARFDWVNEPVMVPLKPRRTKEELTAEVIQWEEKQREADERGDITEARNTGAYAERARRWLARLDEIPEGDRFPLQVTVLRIGDAFWVTCGGEPYSLLQVELRRRFQDQTFFVSGIAGDWQASYLLPRDRYGLGLYQEEPSTLAPGCLEAVIDAVTYRVQRILGLK